MDNFYRFRPSFGFLTHLWKSATRQDHAALRPLLVKCLPCNGIAIDIGAHGGQITRLLAGHARHGLVLAVEPSGYTRAILRLSLWLRGCPNVLVLAMALGAGPGVSLIRTPLKTKGDMGYGLANMVDGGARCIAEPVSMATLDALVEALNLDRVDFIKADIEGFEAAMIAGAHSVLQRFRPVLLLEMDDTFLQRAGSSLPSLWAQLLALGYAAHTPQGTALNETPPTTLSHDVLWLPTAA